MVSIVLLPAFFLYASCVTTKNDCIFPEKVGNQADYYWRDYFGTVPKDAVAGGYSEDGNVTYIGQLPATDRPGIFLGNVYPGKREAVASIGSKVSDGTYVKILCSNPSNKFFWVKTMADESHLLTDYQWIVGGAQGTEVSFVGRANFEGQVQVGRVFDSKSAWKGLHLYNKNGTQVNFLTFELLVLPR